MNSATVVKMALDGWHSQIKNANKLFDSLTDEQLMNEVAPGRNRGIYLLGHLAAVNDKMLPLLGFGPEQRPELFDTFAKQPDRAVAELPSAETLRKHWSDSCAVLEQHFNNLQPDQWFEKHNSVSAEDFAKEPHRNKLNVLLSRTGHLQYHLGQLNFLKS